MPHDKNGYSLTVGDKVLIPATITQINSGPDFCNCSVELDEPMPPDNTKSTFSALNTRQVVKAASTPPTTTTGSNDDPVPVPPPPH